MGKRELLLVTVFVALGVLVYKVTMPAAPDGGGGFGAWWARVRNEIQHDFTERRYERKAEIPASAAITTVAIEIDRASLIVVGEPRDTIQADLSGVVFGRDDATAEALEQAISVSLVPDGDRVRAAITLPEREQTPRRPRVQLTLRVPARLAVEVRLGGGELDVTGVAAVHLPKASGRVRLVSVAGPVTGEVERGSLEIEQAGAVTVKTQRCDVRIRKVEGAFDVEAQRGEVRARALGGPARLEADNIEAELEDINGPVNVIASGGEVRVRGARGPIDAEGRRTTFILSPAVAVPVKATTEHDTIQFTMPPGGFVLEATATDGDIQAPEGALEVMRKDGLVTAKGRIQGGGPLVSLRVLRGDIVVR